MDNQNDDKTELCQLCFVSCDEDFVVVDDDKRKMLEAVQLKLDLNIIQDPVICTLWHISLQDYFYFMKNCLDADTTVGKLCTDEADGEYQSKLNLHTELMLKDSLKYENEAELPMDRKFHEHDMLNEIHPKSEFLSGTEDQEFCLKSEPVDNEIEPTDSDSLPSSLSENHTVQATGNTNYCQICEYKTDHTDQRHMGVHQKMDHECETEISQKYQCKNCSFKTEYRASFQKHILSQHDPSNIKKYRRSEYSCKICPLKTKYAYVLPRHKLIHQDESEVTMYSCEYCEYKTKHKGNIKRHHLSHKTIQASLHECQICSFKTKYTSVLARHKLIHQNESEVTMYSCKYCEYKTKHKRYLNRHLLSHETIDTSLHQCKMCSFQSKYMSSIWRHTKAVHNKGSEKQEQPCDPCEYKTTCKDSNSSYLLSHRDSSDFTIYQCGDCPFTTKYKSNLNRHKLVH